MCMIRSTSALLCSFSLAGALLNDVLVKAVDDGH
jgi:hypothetical protein